MDKPKRTLFGVITKDDGTPELQKAIEVLNKSRDLVIGSKHPVKILVALWIDLPDGSFDMQDLVANMTNTELLALCEMIKISTFEDMGFVTK